MPSAHCRAYFAVNVLNVISELLGSSKHDDILTLGCQILTTFIYGQASNTVDATYNIEKLVRKVCIPSQEHGESHAKCCLRAANLPAMICLWLNFRTSLMTLMRLPVPP